MSLLSALFLLTGSSFFLISAIGVVKLPDVYTRMHAASKSSSLGIGLILIGVTLHFLTWVVAVKAVLTVFFIFLTAPVAAHFLARSAYLSGAPTWSRTKTDEFAEFKKNRKEISLPSQKTGSSDQVETREV